AEARVLGHDPQIARERHEHAAADGVAADHGDRRLGHAGDAAEHARDARLVAERVLLRLEAQELADVGAADERLVPGPGEDHHADGRIRIELLAEVVQRLVHLEGHGVARLGPVEGDRDHAAVLLDEDGILVAHAPTIAHRRRGLLPSAHARPARRPADGARSRTHARPHHGAARRAPAERHRAPEPGGRRHAAGSRHRRAGGAAGRGRPAAPARRARGRRQPRRHRGGGTRLGRRGTPARAGARARRRRMILFMGFEIADNVGYRATGEPCVPGGPVAYFSTLPLGAILEALVAEGVPAYLSNTAGTYLCNQTMYTTRHVLERRGLAIPAGFIHLPQSAAMVAASGLDQPSMDLPLMIRAIETALRIMAAATI